MKRFLREPLAHFVAIGAALFVAFAWKGGGSSSGRIVVTRARIESFAAGFQRTWQRPPTADEMKGLIDGYVREEAAVREAMAAGLDREDAIIRRRLKQKIDVLAENAAPASEAELAAWLAAHPHLYGAEARGAAPALADVRAAVERDFTADRRTREGDALYARLLAKTTVVIEQAPETK